MPSTPLKREKSGRILSDKCKSDDFKLLEVFEIYKEDLRNEYVNLYYALLAWRDSHLRELSIEECKNLTRINTLKEAESFCKETKDFL